jgi:hypothetical protein
MRHNFIPTSDLPIPVGPDKTIILFISRKLELLWEIVKQQQEIK